MSDISMFAGVGPITGEPIISVADLAERLQIAAPTVDETARLQTAIEIASQSVVDELGHSVIQVTETVTIDGTGGQSFLLPEHPVADVSLIQAQGVSVSASLYDWDRAGIVRRTDARHWPARLASITATYTHGYAPVPRSIGGVVLDTAARLYQSNGGQDIRSKQLGAFSVTYQTSQGSSFTDLERTILARYRSDY